MVLSLVDFPYKCHCCLYLIIPFPKWTHLHTAAPQTGAVGLCTVPTVAGQNSLETLNQLNVVPVQNQLCSDLVPCRSRDWVLQLRRSLLKLAREGIGRAKTAGGESLGWWHRWTGGQYFAEWHIYLTTLLKSLRLHWPCGVGSTVSFGQCLPCVVQSQC